jgi:phosphatidylglycerol---prolipoprotein diacylglyceryl transferase
LHSILFKIGPVPIRSYGLMLWIALMMGLIWVLRGVKRTDIKSEYVIDAALYALLAGIVGAHLTSILLDLPFYWRNPSEIIGLWNGIFSPAGGLRGLSFHGGLVGAILAVVFYTRRKGIRFLAMADVMSPGLALGYGIARIGCFLNGCCYGMPTSLPWGVRFHVDAFSTELTPPSHPTQIYAMLASLAILGLLTMVQRRQRFVGQVFFSYLAMYAVYRFLIEFLRKGVTADVLFLGLTEAQIVSLIMLAAMLPLLRRGLCNASASQPVPPDRSKRSAVRSSGGG